MQKQTFRQFSKIFENLRKSSEVDFGNLRKKSKKCRKVLKTIFQHLIFFYKILGSHWKSSEFFGCLRKSSEIFGNFSQRALNKFPAFLNFVLKSSEIVGSLRKSSKVFGKNRKMSESSQTIFRHFLKFFENCRKSSEVFEMLGKLWKPSENFRM